MDRYVFLTNSIRNIGGAQLYMSRKIDWLQKAGWFVDVYYYNEGPIVIENLKQYANNRIPELSLPYWIVSKSKIKKITARICEGDYDKTIIESNETHLCLWGEHLAFVSGGMNVCYPLSENFPNLTDQERRFFIHKLESNLLFGITNNSIPTMLGESLMTANRQLLAIGNTEGNVSDIDYKLENWKEGKTIISIGRLDKPYFSSVIDGVKKITQLHRENHFNLILIGGASDYRCEKAILDDLSSVPNLSVYHTGYINPIPRDLIKRGDVAVGSAGCVVISANEGLLTISVDAKDHKAIGIYGITTNNFVYRDTEPVVEIDNLLEDVLFHNKYNSDEMAIETLGETDYSQHKRIIDGYVAGEGVDISWNITTKQKTLKAIYTTVGIKKYKYLLSHWSTVVGWLNNEKNNNGSHKNDN